MRVHLVNPSDESYGVSIVTPRWAYVLASATPAEFGTPAVHDEVLEPFDPRAVRPGDIVGIGIQTHTALRGYAAGRAARDRGASVVFGGVHAGLYPEEAWRLGGAHAVVEGEADLLWPEVLADCAAGRPRELYRAGRLEGHQLLPARWDLAARKYLWASVQTARGCPKHCSFCSVWRVDGRRQRLRPVSDVVEEVLRVRRRGFRFVLLSDDNFYPEDRELRARRLELMSEMRRLPEDTIFFTQITLDAAGDLEFLDAMKRARIRGAGVGIEAISAEGLRTVRKPSNPAGEELVERLRVFARYRVAVFGAFIFGLPTDRPETFEATTELARRAGVAVAQFTVLTPLPGSVDFQSWEKTNPKSAEGAPLSRYWLIPRASRPLVCAPHPTMSTEEIVERTAGAWKRFYGIRETWRRTRAAARFRSRLVMFLGSELMGQMFLRAALAVRRPAARRRTNLWARALGRLCLRLSLARPDQRLRLSS